MYLRKTIIASVVALVLTSVSSVMAEKASIGDQLQIEATPIIEKASGGFFVDAPVVPNMIVMIVQVFNSHGEVVLNVRSKGEPVELLTAELADGAYSYQVKTILKQDTEVKSDADNSSVSMSRDAGRFIIEKGEMLQSVERTREDSVSLLDTAINNSLGFVGAAFNHFIPTAIAADLVASSFSPEIIYEDSNSADPYAFSTNVNSAADASSGSWTLYDEMGVSSLRDPVIIINTVANSVLENSWVVESTGKMSWGNGKLNLGAGYLSIGAINTNNDFSIFASTPDILLHDDVDDSEVEWELNNGETYFRVNPGTGTFTEPFKISLSVEDDTLRLLNGPQGNAAVVVGGGTPSNLCCYQFVVQGQNPDIRLSDTTTGTAAEIDLFQDVVSFWGNKDGTPAGWNIPMKYDIKAPTNSLTIRDNGNVGLGVAAATEALDVERINSGARLKLTSITSTNNEGAQMVWRRSRASGNSPAAVQLSDNLGAFSFRGHDGSGWTGSRGFINVVASQNWSPGANGTEMIFQTTPNNAAAPVEVMRITQDGKVRINGVALTVPDYVFEEGYELMTLDQLSAYIEENRHLPGVASASEVNTDGLDLAGSQLSVLEKVEELTLYTLQQHEELKQMTELKAENAQLKAAHRELLTAIHSQQEKLDKVDQLEQMVNQLMQLQEGKSVYTSLK